MSEVCPGWWWAQEDTGLTVASRVLRGRVAPPPVWLSPGHGEGRLHTCSQGLEQQGGHLWAQECPGGQSPCPLPPWLTSLGRMGQWPLVLRGATQPLRSSAPGSPRSHSGPQPRGLHAATLRVSAPGTAFPPLAFPPLAGVSGARSLRRQARAPTHRLSLGTCTRAQAAAGGHTGRWGPGRVWDAGALVSRAEAARAPGPGPQNTGASLPPGRGRV